MASGSNILGSGSRVPEEALINTLHSLRWQHNIDFQILFLVGFMTTKGELVRSILFPPPLDFQFHRDFLKSIYVFLTLGLIGMSYSLYMWIRNGVSFL